MIFRDAMTRQDFYASLGKLSGLVTILPASMGIGWMLGYYGVDRFLGTFPWGTILMVFFGAGAGFWQIIRMLTQSRPNNRD
jgi:F0F1-type ATP synthase assembly protein I